MSVPLSGLAPRTGSRGLPGPAGTRVKPVSATGAGYSPVNGEIYRHEVLGEADPRPCDLKKKKNDQCVPNEDDRGAEQSSGQPRAGSGQSPVRLPPLPAA